MNASLIERLKIAAQEANRINALPAAKGNSCPVRVALELDARGIKVAASRGPSLTHAYVVTWSEIESARINVVVAQIGNSVDALTA